MPFFGDGSSGRDYTYVDDIVAGVLAAVDCELPFAFGATPFEIFNLGNSRPVTLTELVRLMEAALGRKMQLDPKPPQLGDLPLTWADISKARRLLGYQPKTSIEEGLRRFVQSYRRARAARA